MEDTVESLSGPWVRNSEGWNGGNRKGGGGPGPAPCIQRGPRRGSRRRVEAEGQVRRGDAVDGDTGGRRRLAGGA
jgi:hypothetical protein